MTKSQMLEAFRKLDQLIKKPTRIIVGGGAAMLAAYQIPISTQDVDGVPDKSSMDLAEFKAEVRRVGQDLGVAPDWLNDYFSTFLFVLPSDYGSRLVPLYRGKHVEVCALAKEELLLMKLFAGREKDLPHAKALMKKGVNLKLVDGRIDELREKNIPGAQRASDLLSDLCGEMGLDL